MIQVDALPKACVILGAGASTDVHNGSAPILRQGNYKPPLARDLFDIERHPEYFQVLQHYRGAQSLAAVLSPLSHSSEFDLEKRLRELAEHTDERVRQQFKHVPAYLRDLLWWASFEYTPTPGTYRQLVQTLLADVPHHVLFLVLNYDTLLEQALSMFDPQMKFDSMESYVRKGQQAKVVKLHGSINWFKLIGKNGSWEELVKSQDVLKRTPDDEVHVSGIEGPLTGVLIEGNRPYPVLTAPLAGKSDNDTVCPRTHIETAKEFLKDCRKFLIIGTSGFDEDLMSLLDSSVKVSEPPIHPAIHVVDVSDKPWQRFSTRVRAFNRWTLVSGSATYGIGFRNYVSSNHLQNFVKFTFR